MLRAIHSKLLVAVSLIVRSILAGEASFHGLGDLPGGEIRSMAKAVSADGSVVVGGSDSASGMEAYRWTLHGGMAGLGFDSAADVSADGSVVVGGNVRWTLDEGMTMLPGTAEGVSADGSVMVGFQSGCGGNWMCWVCRTDAFRWTSNGDVVGLPPCKGIGGPCYGTVQLPPVYARGVSGDGAVVIGSGYGQALRWDSDGCGVGLGVLGGNGLDNYSQALGVSADGSVVVGGSSSAGGDEAFLWTPVVGMIGLGDLPAGVFFSEAHGVSADGSVVVGRASSDRGDEAFIWDESHGMRSVQTLLETDFGVDLTGWHLEIAIDISADGRTIVGTGTNPSGNTEGWVATIVSVEPCEAPGDFDNNGAIDAADMAPFVGCLRGPNVAFPSGCPEADLDGDADVDLHDFAVLGNQFGATCRTPLGL
jgi:probable HAF family extracellular repeat protein